MIGESAIAALGKFMKGGSRLMSKRALMSRKPAYLLMIRPERENVLLLEGTYGKSPDKHRREYRQHPAWEHVGKNLSSYQR
jgi:hypothetical protein